MGVSGCSFPFVSFTEGEHFKIAVAGCGTTSNIILFNNNKKHFQEFFFQENIFPREYSLVRVMLDEFQENTNACVSFGKCTAGLRLNYRIEAKMTVQ